MPSTLWFPRVQVGFEDSRSLDCAGGVSGLGIEGGVEVRGFRDWPVGSTWIWEQRFLKSTALFREVSKGYVGISQGHQNS